MSIKDSEKDKKIEELENQLKRALADYQNLQKRFEKEREQVVKFANEVLLVNLIGILDGLEMVSSQFREILKQGGFERVKVRKGDQFDPKLMEAIEGEGEKVEKVLSAAYKLHDKIIKPARVQVTKR